MKIVGIRMFHMTDKNTGQSYRPETPETIQDMLRYDCAFWNPNSPASVLFVHLRGGPKFTMTYDRWLSFGVKLESAEFGRWEIEANVLPEAQDWVTFQHPRMKDGPLDYSKLEPVPLSEFLAAKDLRAVRERSAK